MLQRSAAYITLERKVVGIGLFPFVFLPWVFLGPIAWGVLARLLWPSRWKAAVACASIATVSTTIPLVAWLWSGTTAVVAGMVVAVPSFAVLVLVGVVHAVKIIKSAFARNR